MNKFLHYFLLIFIFLPLYSCKSNKNIIKKYDDKTYINNFELIQENSINETTIKIKSPKAIINPSSNNIRIYDSSINILQKNGQNFEVKSKNSIFNNKNNLLRVYDNVFISLLEDENSFIKTNSLYWDLNSSNINLNSPLKINFANTKITSSNGFYNIDSGQLRINDNLFKRSIYNEKGEPIYQITIISDMAKWLKVNNSLEFSSENKQVETTINILSLK